MGLGEVPAAGGLPEAETWVGAPPAYREVPSREVCFVFLSCLWSKPCAYPDSAAGGVGAGEEQDQEQE